MQPPTNLNRAEKRLVGLTQLGKPAHFNGDVCRASVIRALCVKAFRNVKVDPKGIQIVGATIAGVLDLEAVKVEFPLGLRHCQLLQRPIFAGADLKLLDLRGAQCAHGIDATDLEVGTKLLLGDGFAAWGEVRLYGAEIGGDLDCTAGRFVNRHGVALNARGCPDQRLRLPVQGCLGPNRSSRDRRGGLHRSSRRRLRGNRQFRGRRGGSPVPGEDQRRLGLHQCPFRQPRRSRAERRGREHRRGGVPAQQLVDRA